MLDVAITAGHPPLAAIIFVTMYVPAVLEAKFTKPVEGLILNPAVELNVPATLPPLNVGDGSVAF